MFNNSDQVILSNSVEMSLFGSKKKCDACGNKISDKEPKVDAMKKHYHAACFVCNNCNKPIKGDFRPVDDKPWCEDCFVRQRAPKCSACGDSILDKRIKTDDGRSFHEQCFHNASQGNCGRCGRKIGLDEPVTEAMGKQFHQSCFRCAECEGELPAEFHLRNDLPICNKCHKRAKADDNKDHEVLHETVYTDEIQDRDLAPNLAPGLLHTETMVRDDFGNPNKEIRDYREHTTTIRHDPGLAGAYTGQPYTGARNDIGHPVHRMSNLRDTRGEECSVCVEPLRGGDHVQAHNRHFHKNCFDTAHSGDCHGCGEKIRLSEPSVTVAALGRDWHTGCLTCGHCNQKITGQFQWHNDLPTCDDCYKERIAPGCAACNEPIVGDKLKAMNMNWHPDCFSCQVCHQPLHKGGREYFNVDGRPYCERDVASVQTAVA